MKCPHCRDGFHDKYSYHRIAIVEDKSWFVITRECPECHKIIINIAEGVAGDYSPVTNTGNIYRNLMVWPKGSSRPPCPTEVSPEFAEDYSEACLVLPDSPKASAALSRRCLQHLLREVSKVKPSDLYHEIQEVIDGKVLPSYITETLDTVRVVGNFAAHPMKSQQTGEIIGVEEGEAEQNLDTLEALFDFYFVQPARIAVKRAAIDQKLKDAGKQPMQQ